MNYYPFHIGDYLSATRHLTWAEDAAFRRLLDVYYTTEKPLPVELRAVYRLVIASTDEQREAVENVLKEFFVLTDAGWINGRADTEIDAMREKQQKQRDKANKRWHKPESAPGNASAMPRHDVSDATASKSDADAMPPTPTPTPTPLPLTPKGKVRALKNEESEGFTDFYEAYPRKIARIGAAKAWASINPDEPLQLRIMAALRSQKFDARDEGRFIPHPATWLNAGRWDDQPLQLVGSDDEMYRGAR